jgi:hypothetical protein
VGLKFQIHDGKNYQDITITEDMVGHKLGEFAPYVHQEPPSWRVVRILKYKLTVAWQDTEELYVQTDEE